MKRPQVGVTVESELSPGDLPLDVPIDTGEGLDSYVEAFGQRYGLTVREVRGLRPTATRAPYSLLLIDAAQSLRMLEQRAGLDRHRLDELTSTGLLMSVSSRDPGSGSRTADGQLGQGERFAILSGVPRRERRSLAGALAADLVVVLSEAPIGLATHCPACGRAVRIGEDRRNWVVDGRSRYHSAVWGVSNGHQSRVFGRPYGRTDDKTSQPESTASAQIEIDRLLDVILVDPATPCAERWPQRSVPTRSGPIAARMRMAVVEPDTRPVRVSAGRIARSATSRPTACDLGPAGALRYSTTNPSFSGAPLLRPSISPWAMTHPTSLRTSQRCAPSFRSCGHTRHGGEARAVAKRSPDPTRRRYAPTHCGAVPENRRPAALPDGERSPPSSAPSSVRHGWRRKVTNRAGRALCRRTSSLK